MIAQLAMASADDATIPVEAKVLLDELDDPWMTPCVLAKLRRWPDTGVTGDALIELTFTVWRTLLAEPGAGAM
jgi:hypothetical protein